MRCSPRGEHESGCGRYIRSEWRYEGTAKVFREQNPPFPERAASPLLIRIETAIRVEDVMRAPRTVSARPTGKRKSSEQDCCDRDCAHESLLARKQPRPSVAHSHLMQRSNIASFEGSPWTT